MIVFQFQLEIDFFSYLFSLPIFVYVPIGNILRNKEKNSILTFSSGSFYITYLLWLTVVDFFFLFFFVAFICFLSFLSLSRSISHKISKIFPTLTQNKYKKISLVLFFDRALPWHPFINMLINFFFFAFWNKNYFSNFKRHLIIYYYIKKKKEEKIEIFDISNNFSGFVCNIILFKIKEFIEIRIRTMR